jgi:Protein of unknown function (DUF3306)
MADRDRPMPEQSDPSEGFLRRWSRRKSEARSTAAAPTEASSEPGQPAPASSEQAFEPEQVAAAPVDPKELPDIESLDASSDYTVFMRPGVPLELRNQALRKLWRSDPLLANLDGLLEYGGDYTIPSWPKGTIRTAYQIGRGFATELEKIAGAAPESEAAKEPLSGPDPEPRAAVASADSKPAADMPAEPPQLAPEPTRSGEAEAASPPARAELPAKPRARPLPRRG